MYLPPFSQTLRILFKEKRITMINIGGLAISLACTLFMWLWVENELSYDRFHDDFRQLYRVEENQFYSGEEPYHVNVTPYVSGPVWKDEIPEIAEQCRMSYTPGQLFTYGEQRFFEEGLFAVDSTFFRLFSLPLRLGDPHRQFLEPNTIVLTSELAKKYFGDEPPLGKAIRVNEDQMHTVTGVLETLPENTVLEFNALLPWSAVVSSGQYQDNWGTNSIQTFVKLQPGAVDTVLNRKLTQVTNLYKENNTTDFLVAPFSRIHLHAYFGYGHSPGAILYVYIFVAIASFVLLIACINFMNLSTARASIRAHEIGLRKTNGATRIQLRRQHLAESFFQTLAAVLLAVLLVLALLAPFNRLTGKEIPAGNLLQWPFLLGATAILVVSTLLAGSWPAFYLSALDPLQAIRERSDRQGKSGLLRKVLVVFQFSLAVLLIMGSMVVTRQLKYMQGADLGFEKQGLLSIPLRGGLNSRYDLLKEEFGALSAVQSTCASMQPPYRIGSNSGGIRWEGKDPDHHILVSFTGVHYDFIKTMGIALEAGRDFESRFPGDLYQDTTANFIINATLARIMEEDLPEGSEVLGSNLEFIGASGRIVGIMEDYHFQTLGVDIEPMAIAPVPADNLSTMIVRLAPGMEAEGLRQVEETWEEILPQYPFESTYVDEVIRDMYRGEERLSSLLSIFTGVAFLLACLGLFALSSFTAQRRRREIGIRKTLGAGERQIGWMMVRDFSLYILLSLVIALPAVWFIATRWLGEFSYRIALKADLFLYAVLATTLVSVLTVLFHALRSARLDPVDTLRHE
ncbi:MAG: FtsX-like permease family protein [Bacteroidales bacterium]